MNRLARGDFRGVVAATTLVALLLSVSLGTGDGRAVRVGPPHDGGPRSSADALPASAFDWPEFHRAPSLGGYATDSSLSASNASELGVAWASDLYGAALDSPVIAYDSELGEALAYIGTENGDVLALNLTSGQVVWSVWLGSPIRGSPLVDNGSLYAVTFSTPAIYQLNATTGAIDCSRPAPQEIEGTPVVATPPGGPRTLYVGTLDNGGKSGPLLAMNAQNCSIEWMFAKYAQVTGSWDAVAYGLDALGVPLVVFGTSDPDAAIYAVNALTGEEVWRFQTTNPAPYVYDVGAGVTISAPGVNGFADGVAYVPNKDGIMFAIDLTTGKGIWQTNLDQIAGTHGEARSTAALDGPNLVFGYTGGLFDLKATNGQVLWRYTDPTASEAISSPALAGAAGHEVAAVADIGGALDVVNLTNGQQLYRYQTGSYVTGSPAVSNGRLLLASADGFLYEFQVGGGNDNALPSTAIGYPADGAALANPNGWLTVTGSAADPTAVSAVSVAVRWGGVPGPWWDAAEGRWVSGPVGNTASLASPGASSTDWSFSFPVARAGGVYTVVAGARAGSGQADLKGATSAFSVAFSTLGPHLEVSTAYVAPGGRLSVTGGGFAPSEKVAISLDGSTLNTTVAGSAGSLPSTRVTIPATAGFGLDSLNATGLSSGRSATAAITIQNTWDQLGATAARLSYEPNDPILNYHVTITVSTWVEMAWHYEAGHAVRASPVIANGVAYVADTAGHLNATDLRNGAPLWVWTEPSRAALDVAPAVDPASGRLFVAGSDGYLYALSPTTGALVWSATVGGNLTAPAFSAGIVYVGSGSGAVVAYSESTGARLWSAAPVASSVTGAPSVDSSTKLVLVGESNGDLVALYDTNGTKKWTYATGSAITAAATLYGGVAYLGAANGKIFGVSESTGHALWSFATAEPVTDTGSVVVRTGGPELFIGSGDGNLYGLLATNGSLNYKIGFGSAIVGVATVKGIVAVATADGLLGAARSYSAIVVWRYTGARLASAPAIVDGTIFATAEDGSLAAFTTYGQLPA